MRYYLILLTLWAFFALNAFSQSPEDRGLTISGTIQDAELNRDGTEEPASLNYPECEVL